MLTIKNKFKFIYFHCEVEAVIEDRGVEQQIFDDEIPEVVIFKVPLDLRYGAYSRVALNENLILQMNEFKRVILRTARNKGSELVRVEMNVKGITTEIPKDISVDESVATYTEGKKMKLSDLPKPTKEDQKKVMTDVKNIIKQAELLTKKVNGSNLNPKKKKSKK